MISNNPSSYKLRASKSSRDVHDYDCGNSDDNYETNVEEDISDSTRRYQFTRDGRYSKGTGRSRSTEFRSSRIGDRRGGYRGRGSGRRSDRDYADNFYTVRKYENTRNSDSLGMLTSYQNCYSHYSLPVKN